MLGLGACHHINLQLFYKVTNPIHKEICKCFRFLLRNEERASVHPHLEWKRQQIYDLSLPCWNTEAAATSSEIQGKAQACETVVSRMDKANAGLLLTGWLSKWLNKWLIESGKLQGRYAKGEQELEMEQVFKTLSKQPPLEAQSLAIGFWKWVIQKNIVRTDCKLSLRLH